MHCRVVLAAVVVLLIAAPADARTVLKNICRVKGQEENTIQGMGLVIGLAGSGDGANFLPTIRGLATMLQRMNNPIGEKGMVELKDAKNVALVMVTATVPAAGARQGDLIECTVSSIGSAKSLEKGVLLTTPLLGPQVGNPVIDQRVYGFAQGPIQLDDAKTKTVGKVSRGCRLEEDFYNEFMHEGKFTLVLNKNHADFQVAHDVAEVINSQLSHVNQLNFQKEGRLARAINAVNIEVDVPQEYRDEPVEFIAQVLSLPISEPETGSRVVINQRTGTVVFGAEVEIGAVAIHSKGLSIEAGQPAAGNRFVGIETTAKPTAKLKSLVEALNALKVPPEDVVAIIKEIERSGKLHGTLVIE